MQTKSTKRLRKPVVKKSDPRSPRTRKDHAAGCRITTEEKERIKGELTELFARTGIKLTLGAYTKHALLGHSRLRRLEDAVRNHATHAFSPDTAREQHEALLGIVKAHAQGGGL